jgi:hypothetical protein
MSIQANWLASTARLRFALTVVEFRAGGALSWL